MHDRIHFSLTTNTTHTQQYQHTVTTFSMDSTRPSLPHRRSTRNTTRSIWTPTTPVPHFPERQPTPPKPKELSEQNSRRHTAHAWSAKKKWTLLTVVAFCQVSMNFNAAVDSNAVSPLNKHFGIDKARLGMTAFLIPYAVGCELWAPWSEEIGRWPVMQVSLGLTNVSVIICALAKSFGGIIGGRVMGGLSSAGGSVTLGMVADMFDKDEQQFAVLWASLFSCLGTVLGGIAGGPIEQFLG
jgi:sugar phosphate permease